MIESILTSVKKAIGLLEDYEHFDPEIVMHVNSVFSILTQLGVGPSDGFSISDSTTTWDEFIGDDPRFNLVQTYMFMKVKLLFDASSMSSTLIDSYTKQCNEYEWRLNVEAENSGNVN